MNWKKYDEFMLMAIPTSLCVLLVVMMAAVFKALFL